MDTKISLEKKTNNFYQKFITAYINLISQRKINHTVNYRIANIENEDKIKRINGKCNHCNIHSNSYIYLLKNQEIPLCKNCYIYIDDIYNIVNKYNPEWFN